jgi:hypothetical protein
MIFYKRQYWVLAPDPEDIDGEFGSWNEYDDSLGTKLIVLIKETQGILHDAMEMYKSEGLIGWEGDPVDCGNNNLEWKEYRNCMVLKNCWDGVIPAAGAEGLYHRLRPGLLQHASIRLEGGLQVPDQNAWLENYPPDIVVYGFNNTFKVELFRKDEHIGTRNLSTQEPQSLSSLTTGDFGPGIYKVTASHAGYSVEQSFSIIDWADLQASSGDHSLVENYQIGANGNFKSVGPLTAPSEMS